MAFNNYTKSGNSIMNSIIVQWAFVAQNGYGYFGELKIDTGCQRVNSQQTNHFFD